MRSSDADLVMTSLSHRVIFFIVSIALLILGNIFSVTPFSVTACLILCFLYLPVNGVSAGLELPAKFLFLLGTSYFPHWLCVGIITLFVGIGIFTNNFKNILQKKDAFWVIPISLVVGVWLIGFVWGDSNIDSPFYLSRILDKTLSGDAFFHAAIYNSLYFFNFPSIMVNGLDFVPYHFGSHFLFSRIGTIIQVMGIQFYQIYFFPLFLPLLLSTLLDLKLVLQKVLYANVTTSYFQVCIFLFLFFGFTTPGNQKLAGLFRSELISESCAVSLIFCSALLIYFFDSKIYQKFKLSGQEIAFISCGFFAIGITKISALYVISFGFLLFFILFKKYKQLSYWILAILSTFVFAGLLFLVVGTQASDMKLEPLRFFHDYVSSCFFEVYFLPLVGSIILLSSFKSLRTNLVKINFIILATLIFAFIPALLFYLNAGNAYYFMIIPFPFLVTLFTALVGSSKFSYLFERKIIQNGICIFILVCLVKVSMPGLRKLENKNKNNVITELDYIHKLMDLRKSNPSVDFNKTLVFIPRSDSKYWNFFEGVDRRQSFLLPALSGVVSIALFPTSPTMMNGDYLEQYLGSDEFINRPNHASEINLSHLRGNFKDVKELSELLN